MVLNIKVSRLYQAPCLCSSCLREFIISRVYVSFSGIRPSECNVYEVPYYSQHNSVWLLKMWCAFLSQVCFMTYQVSPWVRQIFTTWHTHELIHLWSTSMHINFMNSQHVNKNLQEGKLRPLFLAWNKKYRHSESFPVFPSLCYMDLKEWIQVSR